MTVSASTAASAMAVYAHLGLHDPGGIPCSDSSPRPVISRPEGMTTRYHGDGHVVMACDAGQPPCHGMRCVHHRLRCRRRPEVLVAGAAATLLAAFRAPADHPRSSARMLPLRRRRSQRPSSRRGKAPALVRVRWFSLRRRQHWPFSQHQDEHRCHYRTNENRLFLTQFTPFGLRRCHLHGLEKKNKSDSLFVSCLLLLSLVSNAGQIALIRIAASAQRTNRTGD